jgi:hypothetical protein
MDIYLAQELAYNFIPQFSLETAREQLNQKKAQWVAGALGALISRPKPEEIQLVSTENRLEPFWQVKVGTHITYDRKCSYTVTTTKPDVQSVTLGSLTLPAEGKPKEPPKFEVDAVEHCLQAAEATRTYDALTGERRDLGKHLTFAKNDIPNLNEFAPAGVLVVPPTVKAMGAIRLVLAELVKPVKGASAILEERVDVKMLELNFRPVYAFEYEWTPKHKRAVVEFDALTGEIDTGGKTFTEQFKGLTGHINQEQIFEVTGEALRVLTSDLMFDVTASAVGLVVPGGQVAVKIVKAVVDRGK